jgi:uncharacterized protein (TIGR00255 family)
MTGYGRGEAASGDVTIVIELKSVNNRFRDIQLRSPRDYAVLEPRMYAMMKGPFTRGRIEAHVRRTSSASQTTVRTDNALAREYVSAALALSDALPGVSEGVSLSWVMAQSGVVEVTEAEIDVLGEWHVVETALQAAIDDLLQMRIAEGRALVEDLSGHLDELLARLGEVEAAVDGINERLKKRLESRIRRLLGDRFDTFRVVQEAAIQADKADVAEELARLRSHCDQFAEALQSDDAVGRRLDFLLQEMNREVNTIGSKAAEHPVSHRVVDMKSVLERMREQAANVE